MWHELIGEQLRQELAHSVPCSPTEGERIRVLLVEDNGADAELLREALDETGAAAELAVVSTPAECLERVELRDWDLILMDLRLGPHEGHQLLSSLGERGVLAKTPTYVLSSSAAPDDIQKAWRHQIHGYLRKPFTIDGWLALAHQLVSDTLGRDPDNRGLASQQRGPRSDD